MKKTKQRIKEKCVKCGLMFSYLPRTDGKPQRTHCYVCEQKKKRM